MLVLIGEIRRTDQQSNVIQSTSTTLVKLSLRRITNSVLSTTTSWPVVKGLFLYKTGFVRFAFHLGQNGKSSRSTYWLRMKEKGIYCCQTFVFSSQSRFGCLHRVLSLSRFTLLDVIVILKKRYDLDIKAIILYTLYCKWTVKRKQFLIQ